MHMYGHNNTNYYAHVWPQQHKLLCTCTATTTQIIMHMYGHNNTNYNAHLCQSQHHLFCICMAITTQIITNMYGHNNTNYYAHVWPQQQIITHMYGHNNTNRQQPLQLFLNLPTRLWSITWCYYTESSRRRSRYFSRWRYLSLWEWISYEHMSNSECLSR
jgi:hypothetical protein